MTFTHAPYCTQNTISGRSSINTLQIRTLFFQANERDVIKSLLRGGREAKEKAELKRKEKAEKKRASGAERQEKKSKTSLGYGYTSVLAATEDFDSATYRPRTRETKQAYDLILSLLSTFIGDVPPDVLNGAANEVLSTLKDDSKKDFDRHREVEELIGTKMPSEKFAQLVSYGKKITDWGATGAEGTGAIDDGRTGGKDGIDEEVGVAVVFDEDEEEEEGSDDEYEVKDDMDDEDDDRQAEEEQQTSVLTTGKGAAADDSNEDGMDVDDFTTVATVGRAKEDRDASRSTQGEGKLHSSRQSAIDPHDIDAFWLQRQVASAYPDPHVAQEKTQQCLDLLASPRDVRDCENELMALFDYDHYDLVRLLTRNRDVVVWGTRLAKAATPDERHAVEEEMRDVGVDHILASLSLAPTRKSEARRRMGLDDGQDEVPEKKTETKAAAAEDSQVSGGKFVPKNAIDLESLVFSQGGHLMSNKTCKLPEGSFKRTKKSYDEYHVPAPKKATLLPSESLISIASLPKWMRPAFQNADQLNQIQSKVYPVAFKQDVNMLLCAPTGAGKTNVAMLTILREISKYRNEETNVIDLDTFKIIYIAPMKALVAEVVGNFGSRLQALGIKVAELSGDRQLTKAQIAETQIIVTTPEKWDIVTRKATDRSYTNLVRLIIIDEIHLLHDERGPVLENVVCRTIRTMEQTQEPVRLVGLSATLPNYVDVATFLRVDMNNGMFFFDSSYRPCPLKQQYIGITEKKA
ncbi:DEIH-box ATPase, partial [Cladochytrium tenue]